MKAKKNIFSIIVILSVFMFSIIFNINNHAPSATNADSAVMSNRKTADSNSSEEALKSDNAPSLNESNREEIKDSSLSPANDPAGSIQSASIAGSRTSDAASDKTAAINNSNDTVKIEAPKAQDNGLTTDTAKSVDAAAIKKSSPAVPSMIPVKAAAVVPAVQNSNPNNKGSQKESSKYSNIGISSAESYVNIRKEPNTESSVLGKLYRDCAAKILKAQGDWYYVESGSVKGYVMSQYIKTGIPDDELIKKFGIIRIIVDTDGLNVREDPDMTSKKLTTVYQDEKYPVVELQDEWVKVDITDDNVIGYVKKEFVNLSVDFKKAVSREEEAELLRIKKEERMKKETAVKYRDSVDYTDSELKLLACLVHSEAGNQSFEGRLAVANIVLNRVKSSRYPNSIKSVIYQPGQFTVANSGSLSKQLANYENYYTSSQKLSIKAARAALEGANNVGKRLYFHSYRSAVNKGYDHKETCVKIEDQLFW